MSLLLREGKSLGARAAGTLAVVAAAALAAGCGAVSSSSGATAGAAGPATAGTPGTAPVAGPATPGSPAPASPAPVPTITATGAPVAAGQVQCAGWPSGVPSGTLPLTFTPVSALRCTEGPVSVPGKGTFLAGTLQRATAGLGPLAAALRSPDGRRSTEQMCPMYATLPIHLVLTSKDGSAFAPSIPVDGCGHDQQQVLTAINDLTWQTVSVTLYHPVSVTSPSPVQPAGPTPTPARGPGMDGSPAVR